MKNEISDYDNAYTYENVYGHALALLAKIAGRELVDKVHLDISCGFGRIAEPLVNALGSFYVGIDIEESGLESLRERGFETHVGNLLNSETTYNLLKRVAGDRAVGSITFLDTIEHLSNGDSILCAISRFASEHSAYLVISTPNVAHRDIGRKLVVGNWDYTDAGLLDHTHTRLFNNSTFCKALRQAGLHTIDGYDVSMVVSDQHFPSTHPTLSNSNLLGSFLGDLRDQSDNFGSVYQFVRLCVAGHRVNEKSYIVERNIERPFLTAVVRTQGLRNHTLTEVLTCLAGQTSDDFEVIIVGHYLTPEAQIKLERIIEDCPEWLRNRIRFTRVYDGNRTRPLNVGFENALGKYIAILDDDDTPMAHWVETFELLHKASPGCMLRATTVRQNVRNVKVNDRDALRAEGTLEMVYPSKFDLLDHLVENHTPPISVAFPRGVFHDLNIRFDESLTTTEDWDFMMRCVALVGVSSSDTITSIYRWWISDQSSRTEHSQSEWTSNYQTILRKLDQTWFLIPKGTVASIRSLVQENGVRPSIQAEAMRVEALRRQREVAREAEIMKLQEQLLKHFHSSSWRFTAPLRVFSRMFGKRTLKFDIQERDPKSIRLKIRKVRRSLSWKISKPLRIGKPRWWDIKPLV